MNEEIKQAYENLRIAIIEDACNTYIENNIKLKEGASKSKKISLERQIAEDKLFFNSGWGEFLMSEISMSGNDIIKTLDSRVKKELKRRRMEKKNESLSGRKIS